MRYSWNQPCCDFCWGQRHRGREPVRLREHVREWEKCAFCGVETKSGIYVRADPATVLHPAVKK